MKIRLSSSMDHFSREERDLMKHGPQTWPWWRLMAIKLYKLKIRKPSSAWRLWIYTRWGASFGDLFLIRSSRSEYQRPQHPKMRGSIELRSTQK